MRMLRKKNVDRAPLWPWTELLSRRKDMEEVIVEDEKTKLVDSSPNPGEVKPEHGEAIDVLAITDRAELKKLLADRGIKLPGNPSLKSLQEKLTEALKA